MKEMLKSIIDMDKEARKKVRAAEAYRDSEIAELSTKKNRITEEENQKALDSALKKSQKQRVESDAYIEKISERNKRITEEMDTAYREHSDEWVDTIVRNVTRI